MSGFSRARSCFTLMTVLSSRKRNCTPAGVSGNDRVAVFTNGDTKLATADTITANTGLKDFTSWPTGADIFLGSETELRIEEPGQVAGIIAAGTGNAALKPSNNVAACRPSIQP